MEKMQRDAVNRVNEMHKRASQMINPTPSPEPPPQDTPPKKPPENHLDNSLLSSFSKLVDFKIDEEKALIGIIIYILAKNNADPKLLIGLGYLLL